MSNSIAPGSSADVNVKVTALTTNPNVPTKYKTIILKKNLVNGVNTLTQEMMSYENIKYVVKYDYVLGENITIPDNCILEFDGGTIGNINGNDYSLLGNILNDIVKQNWFKTIDDFHRFINNVDGPTYYEYTPGIYHPTVYILKELNNKAKIQINGNNAKLYFPFQASTHCYEIRPKNYYTFISSKIISEVNKGDLTITVDDGSVFSEGQIICIKDDTDYSFSWYRKYYKHGEFAQILNINGNILTLTNPVYGIYKHITTNSCWVRAFNTISCIVKDLELDVEDKENVNNHFAGLCIKQSFGGFINNIKAENFKININIDSSLNFRIINCNSIVTTIQQEGIDAYALAISQCQNLVVDGGKYIGGNHGVAIGGANNNLTIINRNITIRNIEAKQIKEGFTTGINVHGNVEYITIENCNSSGINYGGKNVNILNNVLPKGNIAPFEVIAISFNIIGNLILNGSISSNISEQINTENLITDNEKEICIISDNKLLCSENEFCTISMNVPDTWLNYENTEIKVKNNSLNKCLFSFRSKDLYIEDNNFVFKTFNTSLSWTPNFTGINVYIRKNTFTGDAQTQKYQAIRGKNVYIENNVIDLSSGWMSKDNVNNIENIYIRNNIIKSGVLIYNQKDTNQLLKIVEIINNRSYTKEVPIIFTNDSTIRPDCIVKDNISETTANIASISYVNKIKYGNNIIGNSIVSPNINALETFCIDNVSNTTSIRNNKFIQPIGKIFFDKTINRKLIACNKDVTEVFKQSHYNAIDPIFAQNTLIEGELYHFIASRRYNCMLAFSKVNNNPTDTDLLVVLGNYNTDNYVFAPDPAIYPYIYVYSRYKSITYFYGYTVKKYEEEDGATAGVARTGTFANKPAAIDIYIGFKYFCTDKQTAEGATDGIEIIHKGNDVWVDALGRIVS